MEDLVGAGLKDFSIILWHSREPLVLQVPFLPQTAGLSSAAFPSTPKAEPVGHVGL